MKWGLNYIKRLFSKRKALLTTPIELGMCHVLVNGKPQFKCENVFVGYLDRGSVFPCINLIRKDESDANGTNAKDN